MGKLITMFVSLNLCYSASYGTLKLGKNKATLGFSKQLISFCKMLDAKYGGDYLYDVDFWAPFLDFQYGIMDRINFNVDFVYYPYKNAFYPYRKYTNYTVGFGSKVHIIQKECFNFCFAANVRHYINIDRSHDCHHKYYQERFAAAILGYQWIFNKWSIDAHGGPCYLYYRSEDYYDGGGYRTIFLETGYPLGFFCGSEARIFKHIILRVIYS